MSRVPAIRRRTSREHVDTDDDRRPADRTERSRRSHRAAASLPGHGGARGCRRGRRRASRSASWSRRSRGGAPSPLVAVGTAVIDLAPPGSKELVVALFGTNDKLALNARRRGRRAARGGRSDRPAGAPEHRSPRRSPSWRSSAWGLLAALRDPTAQPHVVLLSSALQVGTGLLVLELLFDARAAPRVPRTASRPAPPTRPGAGSSSGPASSAPSRSSGYGIGRAMLDGRAAATASAGVTIPDPSIRRRRSPPTTSSTSRASPRSSRPTTTSTGSTPRCHARRSTSRPGRCAVHGMVDREVTLTFDELVELPLVEQYVTIACVSNEVGGDLVGNAKWTGVRLTDVLDMAGVQPGATQIVPRSVDGWTAGFPTEWVTAPERPRDALIAVKMNDEPLPVDHGFPARLIVPGLYGYVSATKWLKEIELTTWEAFDGYWVPRGWSKEAPILTQSRIDLPARRAAPRRRHRRRSRASPGPRTAASRRSRSGSTTASGSRRRSRRRSGRRPGSSGGSPGRRRTPGGTRSGPRDRRHRRGPGGARHPPRPGRRPRLPLGRRVQVD